MLVLNTLNEAGMIIMVAKNLLKNDEKVSEYEMAIKSGKPSQFKARKLFGLLVSLDVVSNSGYIYNRSRLLDLISDGIKIKDYEQLVIKPKIGTAIFTLKERL